MTLHVPNLATDVPNLPTDASASTPSIKSPTYGGVYRMCFKRVTDITLVLLSAPIVLPLVTFLAVMIALSGNAPFYSQKRVGQGGVPFRIWKLRTMIRNADEYLETYLEEHPTARAEWDATQKLKNDPRITRLGRLLRKTSADELPQLFNALIGTMSIVGPRPMMLEQEKFYTGQSYYDLKPGITGLWQVCDRNECRFDDRVYFDNAYHKSVSLKADVVILYKTIGVVLRANGH